MSTTHHDPIATGAAANASVINAPLGELDAALTSAVASEASARAAADDDLDDRIDNLIFESETSSSEVVDARDAGHTGSAATTLRERLEWLEGATTVYAAAYGFDDGGAAAANTTAIDAATAAAAATGDFSVVMLPAGHFTINNIGLPVGVVLRGARMPVYDGVDDLLGGTVLEGGQISLGDRSGLMDLGIQVRAPVTKNCVTGGASSDCILLNVACLGNALPDPDRTGHGVTFTAGAQHNVVHNLFVAETNHGLVFKDSYNVAHGLRFVNCAISAITLTSDDGVDCRGNVLTGIHSTNETVGSGGGFRVYTGGGTSPDVYGNVISDFYLQDAGAGIFCSANVAGGAHCRYNRFANGVIETPQGSGVWCYATDTAAGNGADFNDFSNITVVNAVTYSFNNQYGGANNAIHAGRSISPGSDHTFGAWLKADIGADVATGAPVKLVCQLGKTPAQTLTSSASAWTDITWEGEAYDPNGMHAGSDAHIGNPPVNGSMYRIRASIVFAANAAGVRGLRFNRDISGAWAIFGPSTMTTPGAATADCQINLEYMTGINAPWKFKIQAFQNSGGNLDIGILSQLTVELMR